MSLPRSRALRPARVVVLCTPGRAELGQVLAGALGSLCVGVIAKAVMHVPREVADETIAEVKASVLMVV